MATMEARRAEFDDCKELTDLIGKTGGVSIYKATFGSYNLSAMIENSYLSLLTTCQSTNDQKDTVCFMSVNDGLTLFSSEPDAYTKIIVALANYIPVTTNNLMFLNFWILDESSKHYEEATLEMIQKAFTIASSVDFFAWIVPKNFFPSDFILHTFSQLSLDTFEDRAYDAISILDGYKVLFLHRSNFLPKLLVREARIEDNDDLIPILRNSNPDVLVGQEAYFLADLIQKQDETNRFYVGLRNKSAIAGMLATSLDVNVTLIQRVFDISPFPDLMIAKEERPLPPPLLISVLGDLRLVNATALQESVEALGCLYINAEKMKLPIPTPAAVVAESKGAENKKEGDKAAADAKGGKTPTAADAKGGKTPTAAEAKDGKTPTAAEAKGAKDAAAGEKGTDAKGGAVAEDKGDSAEAAANEEPKSSPLERYLREQLAAYSTQHSAPPHAVVLFGYPRSEHEAVERLQEVVYSFDYLLEIHNAVEDGEEDEEDDFLQHHLDAVEVLKEHYSAAADKGDGHHHTPHGTPAHHHHHHHHHHGQGGHSATTPTAGAGAQGASQGKHRASWRRVTITNTSRASGGDAADAATADFALLDAARLVAADVTRIVDHRNERIEAQRARDRAEPPKANALAVTVFAMEPAFASRGCDLMKLAFEEHPKHDYCLFMVDNDHPVPPDLVRCMTYVSLLPGVSFNQSLYLMHRSAFLADYMRVLRLQREQLPALEAFAASMGEQVGTSLTDAARTALLSADVELRDNPAETSFVVTIGNTLVGCVCLSRRLISPEDAAWIRANYHADDLISFERHRVRNQALITHWHLDSIYSSFTRRIVLDIMRQYGKTLFYYHTPRDVCPPKMIQEEFISLKPRRRMQPGGALKCELSERPSAAIGGLGSDCPLYCLTKHFLSDPKSIVAKRVVIVGGSPHAYALLDTLCSVPHLTFPNLYLILERPPTALTLVEDEHSAAPGEDYSGALSMQQEQYPTEQELYAMGFSYKVQLLRGHLSDIDREHKAVVISDQTAIEYDVLVLSTCTQDSSTMTIPHLSRTHPARCADVGVFSLGNAAADAKALRYVQQRYATRSDDVVVSGSGLPVFAAVARLLKFGLAPTRITVVVREPEGTIEGLTEKNITDPLVRGVLSSGIKMCWGATVADVHMSHTGFLNSLELKRTVETTVVPVAVGKNQPQPETKSEPIMVACLALLLCNNAVCDRDVFSAVVDSGLVFDGGLVVDTSFRTVDSSIYALSDFTRFSRVYKDALPHNTFNPREVGAFVALKILQQQLDPHGTRPHTYATPSVDNSVLAKPFVPPSRTLRPPLPMFLLPRAVSCDLPGRLNYFCSRLPVQPEEAVSYLTNSAMADAAGDVRGASRNRNFVLKTDLLGTVVEVTYLGEDQVENRNFALLPGIHESFLNAAAHTHTRGLITDWVEFLRQDWAAAIYQDRFPVLVQALRRSLANDKGMMVMLNRVFERAENCSDALEIADQRREMMGAHGELAPETTLRTIETETIEFLKENRGLLPRFYVPSK